jgi:Xaa-Pro aminopeptidase
MRIRGLFSLLLAISAACALAQNNRLAERRQRAAAALHDGILLLHASSAMDIAADGFHEDPYFFYLTGLENTVGAVLAIDGKKAESWLFLPTNPPYLKRGLAPEIQPGIEAAKQRGLDHVVDWSELEAFLTSHGSAPQPLYYVEDYPKMADLPPQVLGSKSPEAPTWLQIILQKWPAFEAKESSKQLQALMEVQDPEEIASLRSAAKATTAALMAGMRAIRPDVSQRGVEAVVTRACWERGAHGNSFWPWAMSGENAVFPRPFFSMTRYDHLDHRMRAGDLVRLDVGCEWNHYGGDLGRTVPVSGHYDEAQRELWTIYVAAYKSGVKVLRAGSSTDQVFDAWRQELVSHRQSAKNALAQHAIDLWSDRKNVPFWQIHTTNLVAGYPSEPFRDGVIVNYEPIASVDGQGFFLEDMYLLSKEGAELLTPGVPYSAEEIEAAMK